MAARFLVAGGTGNWNSTTNWAATSGGASGASFPVNGDTVTFDTLSLNANMTVNVASACTSIVVSGTYAGTLTFNNTLTVAGTVTFLSTMTIAGTSDLICNTTATLTSGGKTLTGGLQLKGSAQTYTLSGAWVVNGLLTSSGTTSITLNGSTLSVAGGLTVTTNLFGTTALTMTGGTWSGASALRCPLSLAGNVTVSGTVTYNTGTLTYTSGTITVSGSTLSVNNAGTLNTSGMNWNNVTTAAVTVTLLSDLNLTGTFTPTGTTMSGAFNVSCGTFQPSGTFTLSGTVAASGDLTIIATATFVGNFNITAATATLTNAITVTMAHDITISGTTTLSASATVSFAGSFNWNTAGLSLGTAAVVNVSANTPIIVLTGGTWSAGNASAKVQMNLTFAGNVSLSGNVYFDTGTLKWTSGTITVTGSTLNMNTIGVTTTYDLGGANCPLNNLTLSNAGTFSLTSDLLINGTLTSGSNVTFTFAGTGVWSCATFTPASGTTWALVAGQTYTITGAFSIPTIPASAITIKSTLTNSTKANLKLTGTQDVGNVTAVDIDSSAGVTIYDYHGTLTRTVNWMTTIGPLTTASVFVG